ncbi:uncharacterized protein LOC119456439 [Dermacentor silvarum]|uniref:uncharacterized protein LOC119456439 n=1 Tax=Dermacentor silvarum TaxID=543639 RepID=UPI0018976C10|nr:uncharacterized protein LOC119456439 [Dermacentor silvarum]
MNSTDQIVKEFLELLQGIACLARPYNVVLREEATPVVQPERWVPLALLEPLREELDCMERAGIIVKISEPTGPFDSVDCVVEGPRYLPISQYVPTYHSVASNIREFNMPPPVEPPTPPLSPQAPPPSHPPQLLQPTQPPQPPQPPQHRKPSRSKRSVDGVVEGPRYLPISQYVPTYHSVASNIREFNMPPPVEPPTPPLSPQAPPPSHPPQLLQPTQPPQPPQPPQHRKPSRSKRVTFSLD